MIRYDGLQVSSGIQVYYKNIQVSIFGMCFEMPKVGYWKYLSYIQYTYNIHTYRLFHRQVLKLSDWFCHVLTLQRVLLLAITPFEESIQFYFGCGRKTRRKIEYYAEYSMETNQLKFNILLNFIYTHQKFKTFPLFNVIFIFLIT